MKLTIYRDRWSGAEGNLITMCAGPGYDPYMCCLGFLGKALGIIDAELRNMSTLIGSSAVPDAYRDATWNMELATCNDSRHSSQNHREKRIIEMMAEKGVEVTFVDHDPNKGAQ